MTCRFGPWPVLVLLLSLLLPGGAGPRRRRRGRRADLRAGHRRRCAPRRRARGRAARHLADRDRAARRAAGCGPGPGRSTARARATGSGPRRGAGLRQGEPGRGAQELRCRLLPDQLSLARRELPVAGVDVRPESAPTMPRGSCAASIRARRLVGGGGGVPFADPGAGRRLPGAVRPHPRRPRRRAAGSWRPPRSRSRRPSRRRRAPAGPG